MTIKTAAAGAALALAAAGLFASISPQVFAEEAQMVHCYGVNGCKGQNDCKTAKNACKGQGSCKGQGFKSMTLAECNNAGGKVGP
ncbi:hypothetical protein [Pseudomonas sp. 2FG]|uniref:BufA2 family periplasmic bufferin-type metallophore n=1 Tax=Pseudomonas sp. 2FG TaxID=2502191 RepID=UPI0010F45FB9|nr:hypothetical protein [Pseudomonas sp. 2FG]